MPSPRGQFVWYDVMTTDPKAAAEFYRHVVGWNAQEFPMENGTSYTVFSQGAVMIAGLMAIPPEAAAMGMPPCWSGYVAVEDVDAEAGRVQALGGKVERPPEDIPNVGRFAVVSDPGGAAFLLFKPNTNETPTRGGMTTPGHVGWHELYASNLEREWEFYTKLFGWTKDRALDMGPMGIYQTFATGGEPCGGMMTKPPQLPRSYWNYYIGVDGIDAAAARVTERGGAIVQGPIEVPGGAWIIQGRDPQGAYFALISAKR